MSRKFIGKIVSFSMVSFILLSLTACSSNNKESKGSRDTVKTESTKKTPKKKKIAKKKSETESKESGTGTQKVTNNNYKKQSSNNGTVQQSSSPKTTVQQSKTQVAPNKSTSNSASQQKTIINNSDQAISLYAHSMGGASPSLYEAFEGSDGYHVYEKDTPNSVVTVIKPNGDFYDVQGRLVGTYANMAAADGPYNEQWKAN